MRAACAAPGTPGLCQQTAPVVTAWQQGGPGAGRPAAAGRARRGDLVLRGRRSTSAGAEVGRGDSAASEAGPSPYAACDPFDVCLMRRALP
jgi:hypothetical protein